MKICFQFQLVPYSKNIVSHISQHGAIDKMFNLFTKVRPHLSRLTDSPTCHVIDHIVNSPFRESSADM